MLAAIPPLAYLFCGLPAGVLVDRLSRRAVMVTADLGRSLALATLPLTFALGTRTIAQVYLVAAIVGVLTVFFEVAAQAYLPTLLEPTSLVAGNAKLALGEAAAVTGGPALGGLLIGAVGAATAVLADAISYVISALAITAIKKREPATARGPALRLHGAWAEISAGIATVARHPVVRTLASVSAVQNLGESVAAPMVLFFIYHTLHLAPLVVGVTLALGSASFLVGAATAVGVTRRLGIGRMLALSSLLGAGAYLILPLGIFGLPVVWVGLWRLCLGLHLPTYNVNVISVRQALIPAYIQGRVNSILRTLVIGIEGLGPLVGGVLGTVWGPVPTILCGGVIFLLGSSPLLTRTITMLKAHPSAVAA